MCTEAKLSLEPLTNDNRPSIPGSGLKKTGNHEPSLTALKPGAVDAEPGTGNLHPDGSGLKETGNPEQGTCQPFFEGSGLRSAPADQQGTLNRKPDNPSLEPVEQLVICVDDDQNFLKSLEFFLPDKINQEEGGVAGQVWYRFLFFDNPSNALDALRELTESREIVAMIISDQKMPNMKGTELLAEAKKISHQSIRVLLTGYAGVESAITAINENLLDKYLTKPIEDEHDFILSIRHLLQRFRMQGTITDQARVIHDLYQFSNALNGISGCAQREGFQETLDYIVSFTEKMLKCQRISIMLMDSRFCGNDVDNDGNGGDNEGGLLRIKASRGIPEEVVNSTSIPIGDRISGEVFRSKKAILAKNLEEVPYLDGIAGIAGVSAQSFISIPILLAGLSSGDQPLGVINITQKEGGLPFTENDLEILTYIANTSSIAINNQINRLQLQLALVETRTQAAALEYQAMHDALTGLANRNMLKERIQEAILLGQRAARPGQPGQLWENARDAHGEKAPFSLEKIPFSLLIMDLNNFKEINDTLGHHSGDILLQQVGRRLAEVLQSAPLAQGGEEKDSCGLKDGCGLRVEGCGLKDWPTPNSQLRPRLQGKLVQSTEDRFSTGNGSFNGSDVPHFSLMKGRIPINYHPHPASPLKGEENSRCSHKRLGTSVNGSFNSQPATGSTATAIGSQAVRLGNGSFNSQPVQSIEDRFATGNSLTTSNPQQSFNSQLATGNSSEDMLARLGGDEFAVLLPGAGMERTVQVVGRILEAFRQPFSLEGLSIEVGVSIGLALYPEHAEEANLLIQRADVAMYLAKNSGSGYSAYDPKSDQYNHRRLAMVSGLRQAIEENQLVLHYQPKIDLKSGCIIGVEALVRWQHPQYGFMPPDQFIQLAEQTDLIKPLTLWVLNEALGQGSQLCKNGLEISMAVNLSARNLQDKSFPDQVHELLKKWEVKPKMLDLEITESTVMADPHLAMAILKRLSEMGIQLAIDDFGTGHSSLAYIKLLPVHEIKIDKSFVMSMGVNTNDIMIVNTAIDLGHNLGLSVVAEGVENKETYDRLTNLGCNVAQGFFMSRPLPATQLMKWIEESPWGVKKKGAGGA